LFVGVINTLAGAALIFCLYNLAGVGYWLSSAIGYVVGCISSFYFNKTFTFGVKEYSARQAVSFIATIVVCYVLAYGVAQPATYAVISEYSVEVRDNLALLVGICLFTGLNYLGQRFVVFPKSKRMKDEN
jgi:putative flippase GtrA